MGDAGPTYKVGEASLRMAKAINPKASPYNRPVSDLSVSYLIFPQSADEKKDAPNLDNWHAKVQGLVDNIGGIGAGFSLHQWEDHFKSVTDAAAPTVAPAPEGASITTQPSAQ
ncbi:MAG: glycoside hydrolase family 75 protein [Verrucomicrobiota bacterium]